MNRLGGSQLTYDMGEVVREEVCLWGFCAPEATVQAAAIAVFGVLTVLVLVGLAHVYDARDALADERERVADERDAFRRFAAKVQGIDASAGRATAGTDAPVAVRTKPPDSGMGTVREAYRETVMGVPHFDDEYDEELVTNATAELSPEVAAALAGNGPLTPQLRKALATQSREAAASRENLIDAIDGERERVREATEDLERIEGAVAELDETAFLPYTYGELEDAYDRLEDARDDTDTLVTERQATLHAEGAGAQGMDGHDFRRYVYGSLDTTYPVLTDASALIDYVEDVQSQVVRSLLRRA
jgi:type II secretory pathway pseudopilin PulG